MVISYHGGYFIKITQGDTIIAINPFSKKSKFKPLNFGAHIGLVSMDHPDMNGAENLAYGDKVPFVISGAGEYEIGGTSIYGFPSGKPVGKDGLLNTIYVIDVEGVHVCHLGAMPTPELSGELAEGIGEPDILFVPIAGGEVLSPADAAKIANSLDAKLVIPIAHEGKGDKQLKAFLKEAGAEDEKPVEKLTLKKKDLEGKEGDAIVLDILDHA
jgi:L-ascorbate metabolism protein UlaG (beta-lactamase superfamily)